MVIRIADDILGMVKYVVGRDGWKSMVVNRLMYGCGALVWYQHECDDLDRNTTGWYGTVALGCWTC